MAVYKLSTLYKKSAEERTFWRKDGLTVVRIEGFRWGTFYGEFDQSPDVDLNNPDGIEMYSEDGWELDSLDDGSYADWEWPDGMPDNERERLDQIWSEDSYEGLEAEGWVNSENECWFFGPLELSNTDTAEVWRGNEQEVSSVYRIIDIPETTDWFPVDINPVYVGQYEVSNGVGEVSWPFPEYADWDGSLWKQNGSTVDTVVKWRGLSKNPNAE